MTDNQAAFNVTFKLLSPVFSMLITVDAVGSFPMLVTN